MLLNLYKKLKRWFFNYNKIKNLKQELRKAKLSEFI
jgi:hypothetical protein